MKKTTWLIFALLAITLLFFGNNLLPVTDNVESNYALTAKEMVLSGDWLSPQIFGRYWYDKPVFFYWLTAFSFKIFGFTEFAARFAPACFGLATLAFMAWSGTKLYYERAGFYAGIILWSSLEFFLISKLIITDAVLFFCFSATMIFFYLGYTEGKRAYWYGMYIASGCAVLTKGPIGCLLPGLIMVLFLLLKKDWRCLLRMQLPTGILLFLAVVVPWYGLMYQAHGKEFLDTFLGVHNYLRATVSEHPKNNVFYFYTAVTLGALLPWSGLLGVALYQRIKHKAWQLTTPTMFLLLWAFVVIAFFQCMATKYLTYSYPSMFPLCLLLGKFAADHKNILASKTFLGCTGVLLVILFIATYKAAPLAKFPLTPSIPALLGPYLLLLAAWIYTAHNEKHVLLVGGAYTALYIFLIQSIALPFANYRSNKDLSQLLDQHPVAAQYMLFGYYPTSVAFYSDHKVVLLIPQAKEKSFSPKSGDWSSKNVMPYAVIEKTPFAYCIVEKEEWPDFLKKTNRQWEIIDSVKCWDLVKAKK